MPLTRECSTATVLGNKCGTEMITGTKHGETLDSAHKSSALSSESKRSVSLSSSRIQHHVIQQSSEAYTRLRIPPTNCIAPTVTVFNDRWMLYKGQFHYLLITLPLPNMSSMTFANGAHSRLFTDAPVDVGGTYHSLIYDDSTHLQCFSATQTLTIDIDGSLS